MINKDENVHKYGGGELNFLEKNIKNIFLDKCTKTTLAY